MTQTELSDATGITQSLICNYERCKVAPTEKNLRKMAEALGCEDIELLVDVKSADSQVIADYLGISRESTLKLRNMSKEEKTFFDGLIRGYTA